MIPYCNTQPSITCSSEQLDLRCSIKTIKWLSASVIRASDLQSRGCGFKFRPVHYQVTALGNGAQHRLIPDNLTNAVTQQIKCLPSCRWFLSGCRTRELCRRLECDDCAECSSKPSRQSDPTTVRECNT